MTCTTQNAVIFPKHFTVLH